MRAALLALGLCLTGCGLVRPAAPEPPARPPVQAPPPALVEPPAPPPAPQPPPEPVAPPPPPEAPKGSIETRSVYEQPGLSDWTLANGMRVVYKYVEGAEDYALYGAAPGGFEALDPDIAARVLSAQRTVRFSTVAVRVGARQRTLWGEGEATLADAMAGVTAVFDGRGEAVPEQGNDLPSPTDGPWDLPVTPPTAPAEALAGVFDRPGDLTLILVGGWDPAEVEARIGQILAPIKGRLALIPADAPPGDARLARPQSRRLPADAYRQPPGSALVEIRVPFEWDDLPALFVLESLLSNRPGVSAVARVEPRSGVSQLTLALSSDADLDGALRPATDDEVARARQHTARERSPDRVEAWIPVVAALYAEPGPRTPARNPNDARAVFARIPGVSQRSVNNLLRQLAGSPSRATVTFDSLP